MKHMKSANKKFDVVVIGGGPAGIMAAGRAAQLGAKVVLIEKNKELGKKLLMTGKGRCNITQANDNSQDFTKKLGKNGKFIFSALSVFGPKNVIDFFAQKKIKTKIERGGRVFPVTDDATVILWALKNFLEKGNVEIMLGEKICDFMRKENRIKFVKIGDKKIFAKSFILCTGGKSYPSTGSTGDGYAWAKQLGHKIIEPIPALTPLVTEANWVKELQGLSLKNVEVNIFQENKRQISRFGEMLFTHFGLSGPIILDMSKDIGKLLKNGKVFAEIDLKPALDFKKLDARLQRDFLEETKKDFKNYLPTLLPKKLIPAFISFSNIPPDKKLGAIGKEERKKLIHLLKGLRIEISELKGFEQAIITSGGVSTKEVDSKTMRSKKIDNLFFAGEILDLDGPTGGYNLQICWSTGFVAGTHAAEN